MAGVIYVIFARIVFWVVPPESRTLRFLWLVSSLFSLLVSISSRFSSNSSLQFSSQAPTQPILMRRTSSTLAKHLVLSV
ncbi:hypothetical protein LB505_007342 [Fusarium chuoi]|nr:hypothetical protein LB505_007342 [Fusarium chuoi]